MMNPNENLKEQLQLVSSIQNCNGDIEDEAARLADLVEALDDWLRNGGHPPDRWYVNKRRSQ